MAQIMSRGTFAPAQVAVVSGDTTATYGDLFAHAATIAADLLKAVGPAAHADPALPSPPVPSGNELDGKRVALIAPPGVDYVVGSYAVWMVGGIVVPLALSHPPAELQYVLEDAKCDAVLCHPSFDDKIIPIAESLSVRVLRLAVDLATGGDAERGITRAVAAARCDASRGALIIYTSGTTGRAKGALHSHGGLLALIESLVLSWEWRSTDRILHCLPLHHIHGINNAWLCAMYAGACVEFVPKFSMSGWWDRITNTSLPPITIFMGVPTMFHYLLGGYDAMTDEKKKEAGEGASRLRLTISGSAACPIPIHQAWEKLSGQKLLERYGMTEIGMALSNPYATPHLRKPGSVGKPLPGVEVKVVPFEAEKDDGDQGEVEQGRDGELVGELRVRGKGLFKEYFGKAEVTRKSFDDDGFFKTGDAVAFSTDTETYRILGRTSVDVIKSGGYKLSALEIESLLLDHPSFGECAVLGIDHSALGQQVAVVVAHKAGAPPLPDVKALSEWGKSVMAPYKIPKIIKEVDAIPRNAMGKVNKVELKKQLFGPFAPAP